MNYLDYMGTDTISPELMRDFFMANPYFGDISLRNDLTTEEYLSKVADRIRNSPFDVTGVGKAIYPALGLLAPNPFYKAAAMYMDIGGVASGGEADKGVVFILVGKDKGMAVTYNEQAGGIATEWSVGLEIGRIDYTGEPEKFTSKMIYGNRVKGWIGADLEVVSVGGAVAWSNYKGKNIISTSIGISFGPSLFPIIIGGNKGIIENK